MIYSQARQHLDGVTPDGALQLMVPDGAAGTREVLKHMRQLVLNEKMDTALRHLAVNIIAAVPPKNWDMEAAALLNFVRQNVRYTLDTNQVEVLQMPQVTLNLGYGDCDDMAVLLATLLEAAGHETAFIAVGFGEIGEYSHVLVMARIPQETDWLTLDATEPVPPGWFPPGVTCEMIAPNY